MSEEDKVITTPEEIKKTAEESVEEVIEEKVDEVELKAREQGWRPEEEFEGETGEWIDAGEFVRRGPLLDAIHKSNRDTKKALKQVDVIQKHYEKLEKARVSAYEKQLTNLKSQKTQALDDEDTVKAMRLDDNIKELEEKKPEPELVPNEEGFDVDAFANWRKKETWYGDNMDMTDSAEGYGARLEREGTYSTQEILDKVTTHIRTKYPKEFGVQRPTTNSVEGTPARKRGASKSKGTAFKDLPVEAQEGFKYAVKSSSNPGGVMTAEEYLKDYDFMTKN